MVILQDLPGHYNQEGNTPHTVELPISKMTANQPQQSSNTPNDDDVILIPHDMFDVEPTPAPILALSTVNTTSESPIKVKPMTKPTPTLVSDTYACLANDNNNNNNDDDEIIPIPHNMFNKESIPVTVDKLIPKVMSKRKIKVKPTTKPTPTRDDDDANVTIVIVETRKLQNTKIKRNLHTTALLDLGSMVNNNKNMPDLDQ